MGNLSAFMRPEILERKPVKYVASKAFVDENGAPVEWELLAPTQKEADAIMESCTRRIPVNRARTQFTQETDRTLYLCRLVAASVVYPNLNDAELQNYYGVQCAEDLVRTMLSQGEYSDLMVKVNNLCGFNDFSAQVEYVKN